MAAGVNHFVNPHPYLKIIPPAIPFPIAINFISGAAEIIGGLAALVFRLRRIAGWGLIILLLAVFPANIYMVSHGSESPAIPVWILWARLPFQFVLIAWVYLTCLKRSRKV